MARTIGFLLYFIGHAILTALAALPLLIIRTLTDLRLERTYLIWFSRTWSRLLLHVAGAEVVTSGTEHVPDHDRILVVSNHQSFADIPLLQGYIDKPFGFLAKADLERVPILGPWMRAYGCVFIDRGNLRTARGTIDLAAAAVRSGVPLVVFPEGTRSKGGPPRRFKSGTFRIAYQAQATIVPVTVDGVADLLERKGHVHSARLQLTVHPPIDYAAYADLPVTQIADQVEAIVRAGLRSRTNSGVPTHR